MNFGNIIDHFSSWLTPISRAIGSDVTYAKQFYARQANLAFQSGSGNNWLMASFWDGIGGFVQLGTGGTPQSPGQALWSLAFSVPSLGGGTFLIDTYNQVSTAMATTSAISSMFSSVGDRTQMPLADWASGVIGAAGGLIGARGDAYADAGAFLAQQAAQIMGKAHSTLPHFTLAAAARNLSQSFANTGQILSAAASGAALGGFLDSIGRTTDYVGPQVGGVLFDHCDTVLTGIGEIDGAYWDEHSQSIILFGKPDAGGKRQALAMPALDADHLRVALRAAIAGQPLGVSIDPPANHRYGKNNREMLPDGSPLIVSYLGDTAGTLFGAIMFESDRIMKCLSIGMENRSRKPFTAKVPGFKDLFARSARLQPIPTMNSGAMSTTSWHRFWFVIDNVRLLKSARSDAVIVDDVQIKVLTELEMPNSPKGHAVDPDDAEFAKDLTKNFDAYAREFPVFARLKELAKISAIARFMVAQKAPLDTGFLFQHSPTRVSTPETTPSILRTESDTRHTRQMCGGVDLDADPEILPDSAGKAEGLCQAVKTARNSSSSAWAVTVAGKRLEARAIRLSEPHTFRHVLTDHRFPSAHNACPLVFQRIYDSSLLSGGDFGPGWNLFLPYSMQIIHGGGKKAEVLNEEENHSREALAKLLILRDTSTGNTTLYRPTTATQNTNVVYACVRSQTVAKGRVSFEYDPNDVIHLKDSRFYLSRRGLSYVFSLDGRLLEWRRTDSCTMRLSYHKGQLVRIWNDAGHSYEFSRNRPGSDLVTNVNVSEVPTRNLTFSYDESGRLRQADGGTLANQRYGYGLRGQLVEIRDIVTNACALVPQHPLASTEDDVHLPLGGSLHRNWTAGHLASIEDDAASRVAFAYGSNGLRQVSVHGRRSPIRNFEYDSGGHLRIKSSAPDPVPVDSSPAITSQRHSLRASRRWKLPGKARNRLNPVSITRSDTADSLIVHFR